MHGMKARNYGALKSDCQVCPSQAKCCPNTDTRRIRRDKYEIVRDFARDCTASEFNPKAQARRKKGKTLFAQLKRILRLGRLRLRGPCGVQDEFTRAAIAQKPQETSKTQANDDNHRPTTSLSIGRPIKSAQQLNAQRQKQRLSQRNQQNAEVRCVVANGRFNAKANYHPRHAVCGSSNKPSLSHCAATPKANCSVQTTSIPSRISLC